MKNPLINGEAMEFRDYSCAWFECCSCGLTHLFVLTANKDTEKPAFLVYRDDLDTIANRPKKKRRK